MDSLIRITKNITFDDLKKGRKSPVDVYEEQMNSWLFRPLDQLAADRQNTFENGYAMFGLELFFLSLMENICQVTQLTKVGIVLDLA